MVITGVDQYMEAWGDHRREGKQDKGDWESLELQWTGM